MAYEDYLASQAWRNTGLLNQGPTPAPVNYYQQIMQQMAAQPAVAPMAQGAGGYKPGIYDARTEEQLLDEFKRITSGTGQTGTGGKNPQQEQINKFFDSMTPTELAAFQKKNAAIINRLLTPLPLQLADFAAKKMGYAGFLPFTLGDGLLGGEKKGVVTVGEGEAVADGNVTAPSYGVIDGSGGLLGDGNAAALIAPASTTATISPSTALAGLHGTGGGGMSAGFGAPGATSGNAGALGTGASGMAAGAGGGGGGGGGVGSGGSCCFIMLEARYGDGTMDAVVRRYRDEKMTDKNRRGYYKLAEVFVPLMRESRVFKFLVAKTFADPLVSYGKYHYGENKHGWLFKPVEKFWMKVFNTLGTDTKFIRENGEVV